MCPCSTVFPCSPFVPLFLHRAASVVCCVGVRDGSLHRQLHHRQRDRRGRHRRERAFRLDPGLLCLAPEQGACDLKRTKERDASGVLSTRQMASSFFFFFTHARTHAHFLPRAATCARVLACLPLAQLPRARTSSRARISFPVWRFVRATFADARPFSPRLYFCPRV